MVHFGCLGYSPRTSSESAARPLRRRRAARRDRRRRCAAGAASVEIGYRPGEPKRVTVDGAAERSVERLLGRFPVLVFTPDRLRLVQGPPALRRCLLRPRPGAPVAGAGGGFGRVRAAGWRSETTCCAGSGPAVPAPMRSSRGTRCWPRPERRWSPRGRGSCTRLAAAVRRAAGAARRRSPATIRCATGPTCPPASRSQAVLLGAGRATSSAADRRRPAPRRRGAGRARPRPARCSARRASSARALLALILAEADLLTRGARRAAAAAARRRHQRARPRTAAAVCWRQWRGSTSRS